MDVPSTRPGEEAARRAMAERDASPAAGHDASDKASHDASRGSGTWFPGRGTDPGATAACSRADAAPEPTAAPGAMVVDMADAPFSRRAGQ
jgi:hypothetical protein